MEYLDLAQELVERASGGGAQAEALIMHSQTTMIRVRAGAVEEMSAAESRGAGVRVIKDGRTGFAYTSDFEASSLHNAADDAAALVETTDRDEFRGLPEDPDVQVSGQDLRVYDPELIRWSGEDKVAFVVAVERAALAYDQRVIATSFCTYQDYVSRMYLANSQGFAGCHEWTGVMAYLRAVARDESGQTAGPGLGFSVYYQDLDAEAIGREAASNAVRILGGRPVKTQEAPVILDPFAGVEFLTFLAEALSAESVQRGRSFLAGKMGEKVAADRVNVVDDGRMVGGFASAPFDGEGVSTSRSALLVEGRLEQLLYDSYTARKDGAKSTGNARRTSYRGLPYPAPTNLYLEPGPTPRRELLNGVKRGLYVTNTMNTGGINPINGDYSVGASGLWVENGETVGPVAGVTIASNMSNMLHNLSAIGDDLRFIPLSASIGAPTMIVEGMTIGGTAR